MIMEYIEPSSEEKEALWNDCIFVFDANVLLSLYRYSAKTKEGLLSALEKLQDKLWLPHQVAYEYAKNRSDVILDTCNKYKSLDSKIDSFITECLDVLRLNELDDEIVALRNTLSNWLTNQRKSNLQVTNPVEDIILDKLLGLYNGKVGQPYTLEASVAITEEGEKRYNQSIPPGFKDRGKKSLHNDNNAYGDFIVWKQIISYASSNEKNIIYITNDQKEDWWNIISGKTIGPRVELRKEFTINTGRKFHMYTVESFMKYFSLMSGIPADQTIIDEVALVNYPYEYNKTTKDFLFTEYASTLENSMTNLQRQIDKREKTIEIIETKYADRIRTDEVQNQLNNTKTKVDKLRKQLRANRIEYMQLKNNHIKLR